MCCPTAAADSRDPAIDDTLPDHLNDRQKEELLFVICSVFGVTSNDSLGSANAIDTSNGQNQFRAKQPHHILDARPVSVSGISVWINVVPCLFFNLW